jgi:hypothetical protein
VEGGGVDVEDGDVAFATGEGEVAVEERDKSVLLWTQSGGASLADQVAASSPPPSVQGPRLSGLHL